MAANPSMGRIIFQRHGIDRQFMPHLEVNHHSFSGCKTSDVAARSTDSFLAEFNLSVQIVVRTVRVVMDETEAFDPCFDSKVRDVVKRGVTPAMRLFVFLVRILGVMQQQVRPPTEFGILDAPQPTLMLETEFIVGKKDKDFTPFHEFVAIAAIGVTERNRADLQSVETAITRLPVRTFAAKIEFGFKEVEVHGEIRCLHLVREEPSDGILGMGAAAQGDRGAAGIGWLKKRKTNQMVPMRMSEEKTNLDSFLFLTQVLTKVSQSGTGIDNYDLVRCCADL